MKYFLSLLFISITLLGSTQDLWTPEEIIYTKSVSNAVFSPDGKLVVWTQRKGVKKADKFVSDLYLARLDMKKDGKIRTFQLTNTDDSDNSPLFSQDSEQLYFLSSREKGKVLWRLNLLGGEPEKVHTFEKGISSISWLKPGIIAYTSGEGKSLYDIENEKDNTQIVEDTAHWNARRLYSFDVKKKQITRLTDNKFRVRQYASSKDGKYLIYQLILSPNYGADANPKPQYFLKNLNSDETMQVLQGMQEPGQFQFPNSGEGFYFTATKSSNPQWNGAGINELYYFDLSTNEYQKVALDWENGMGRFWLSGNDVVAQLPNGPLYEVAYYRKSNTGWTKHALDFGNMANHVVIMSVSEKGDKIIYNHSTASQLPEYYVANLTSSRRSISINNQETLTSLNDGLKKKPVAKSEIIYWTGAKDEEVNGILYFPKNYEPGKKYPLILSIHGGPTGADHDSWSERWSTYPQIYTDKGAFVLKPNYHGSGSHNLAFIESIKNGNYYHLEQIDLYNGIQHLNEKGWIDMDKLGLMGWSNGAILATWMTLKYPDMFKVAAPGAGDINWTSDYGTCQFGVTFDQSYFGGAPWDDTNGKHYNEWYINNSPIFEIEKIKTPTIIFHGSEDRAVPRDQSWEYYRGLQQVGVAPVKFLWFPGQPHGLQKITHQLRKMKEEIKWIDQHLFGKAEERNEALKPDSPLATQMTLDKSPTKDGQYGMEKDGVLIPEVIEVGKDSIAIGRFEVTIAQYHSYTGDTYSALHANHPITGLSSSDIQGYLSWLSEKTGTTYRLPNEKEAKKLHALGRKSAKSQNNLNYWAGYDLTATDADKLNLTLTTVKNLIKPVGSHPAIKLKNKDLLFDLGGNVAEYYSANGALRTYDYSGYDFVDPFNKETGAEAKNTGIRVIRE
ncbi:MAG: prolyl oligopeptidase family serine peptidase [Cytophagales bacterium]|nr:prolyl oligopeptidase family serine peptidase [Cytophagales bacterium]